MTARERGEQAIALAERYGFDDRPIVAPAFAALASNLGLDGRVR